MRLRRPVSCLLALAFTTTHAAGELIANPVDCIQKITRDDPMPDWVGFGALPAKPWEEAAPYEPLEATRMKTARVSLARNEFENAHIVLRALGQDEPNVRFEVGPVRHAEGGAAFPDEDIRIWKAGYVEMFSLWKPDCQLGWWPDPLMPFTSGGSLTLEAGQNQSMLVQCHASTETSPGMYRALSPSARASRSLCGFPWRLRCGPLSCPRNSISLR